MIGPMERCSMREPKNSHRDMISRRARGHTDGRHLYRDRARNRRRLLRLHHRNARKRLTPSSDSTASLSDAGC
jgi:hypothetical protein